MRQTCNVAFAVQAESFTDEAELRKWRMELEREPGAPPKPSTTTSVAPQLLDMLGQGR